MMRPVKGNEARVGETSALFVKWLEAHSLQNCKQRSVLTDISLQRKRVAKGLVASTIASVLFIELVA